MISIPNILYIVLLILFALSMLGILRSDRHDNARLFYGSVFVFILSIVGAIFVWLATIFFNLMAD